MMDQRTMTLKALVLGPLLLLATACVGLGEDQDGGELNDEDLRLEMPSEEFSSLPGEGIFSGQIAMAMPPSAAAPLRPLTPKFIQPTVNKLQLSNSAVYAGGILGWVGSAKAFVAPTSAVPDDHRLYWVMVKVLSEKYSCFMTGKQSAGARLLVRCADGRRVLLHRERGVDFVQFHAHQYDQEGYEILVKQHKKVRVDGAAGLDSVLAMRECAGCVAGGPGKVIRR